jgi:iron complex outermembrane receptor protein
MKKLLPILFFSLFVTGVFAQITLHGTVREDSNGEPIVGASVSVKGKSGGTTTDAQGRFSLSTNAALPLNIVVYSVGLARQEFAVANASASIDITLSESLSPLNEVVVSASRIEERQLRSPVSIEKMDNTAIRNTACAELF